MAGRRRTRVRIATASAVATVVTAIVLAAPVQLRGGDLALSAACAEAAPSQATTNVGLVVDFGVLGGGDVRTTCVGVAPGINGLQALQAAGHEIRLDGSGLLCAIDRVPESGCGERTAERYRYWAYFHGSGSSWSYSSIGPGVYRVAEGTVEGWHFIEGAGNPSDPPPRRAPTNICPSAPPPSVAPTTAPPPPPTTVAAPPPGASTGDPTAGGGPAGAAPTATPTTVAGAPNPATDPMPDGADSQDDPDAGDGAPTGTAVDVLSSPAGSLVIGEDGVASDVTVLASAQNPEPASGQGAPVATILALVIVAGLGGAAAWRFRSRPDPSG